jgi:hypothetical protein
MPDPEIHQQLIRGRIQEWQALIAAGQDDVADSISRAAALSGEAARDLRIRQRAIESRLRQLAELCGGAWAGLCLRLDRCSDASAKDGE